MKKKLFASIMLIAAMASSLSVSAEEYTADGTGECKVSATVSSSYSVQVPATLELQYNSDSGEYEGSYTVSAKGNILPSQSVTVQPVEGSFTMTGELTGETCQATVTQESTEWIHSSIQTGDTGRQHISADEYTGASGKVAAGLTAADNYTGEFTFAFSIGDYAE